MATTAEKSGSRDDEIVETDVPARIDRLPWSRWHWRVLFGLGTVWLLDGLEVQVINSISPRLGEKVSGLSQPFDSGQLGLAASLYVAGACVGALVFGRLADRLGRKKLFITTLALYLVATMATGLSWGITWFYVVRTLTGAGIGGEYAAINSAIDELIPARVRGTTDLVVNGTYWLGSAMAGALSLILLNTSIVPGDLGWRLAFLLGGLLGLGVLYIRRGLPESPRWLFTHARNDEAEKLVADIEKEVAAGTDEDLPEPEGPPLKVRARGDVGYREVIRAVVHQYPKRAALGLALFVGQAFLYNAVTFTQADTLTKLFGAGSATVGVFVVPFALGNFLGPVLLGRLFDVVGRRVMVTSCYVLSGLLLGGTAFLLADGHLNAWTLTACESVTFFFASAGASAAYLTVSEIFPLEMRALAIAFFYAVGTGLGGIVGPALFGNLVAKGKAEDVAFGFAIGAAVMVVAGLVEAFIGVEAAQQSLETVTSPLSAVDDEGQDDKRDDDRPQRAERLRGHGGGWSRVPTSPTSPSAESMAAFRSGEIDRLIRELRRSGPLDQRALAAAVNARSWGPGRYRAAVRAARRAGEIVVVDGNRLAAGGGSATGSSLDTDSGVAHRSN
jgi:MFS family permease